MMPRLLMRLPNAAFRVGPGQVQSGVRVGSEFRVQGGGGVLGLGIRVESLGFRV